MPGSPYADRDAVICDGAIRSGKTMSMSLSFVLWAMETFTEQNFAVCGKTISSAERNVIRPLKQMVEGSLGMQFHYSRAKGFVTIKRGRRANYFYVFGGKDESSYALVQGITLAGVLLDEVALMPRSFVEQSLARCSVDGSRFWFNCNPESPSHWFYEEWITEPEEHNAFYLHFSMTDNPSLTDTVYQRYQSLYSGVFYDRYILGRWVRAEGLVYPMFSRDRHLFQWWDRGRKDKRYQEVPRSRLERGTYYVSLDYGTYNPLAAGLWFHNFDDGVYYMIKELYHDGRKTHVQYTDEQYYEQLVEFIGGLPIRHIIIDPSASSFITCIYKHGRYNVARADNAVIDGIRNTATAFHEDWIRIHESCTNTVRELETYAWDEKAVDDRPLKESDHMCDSIRYFVETVIAREKYYNE